VSKLTDLYISSESYKDIILWSQPWFTYQNKTYYIIDVTIYDLETFKPAENQEELKAAVL
jgi:hypothetical protein